MPTNGFDGTQYREDDAKQQVSYIRYQNKYFKAKTMQCKDRLTMRKAILADESQAR
jgi:hypothetical protein